MDQYLSDGELISAAPWCRPVDGGLLITVRLTPGSSADGLEGIVRAADGQPHLKAKVRSVAEKGKANKALIALLSKCRGLAKSNIVIRSGGKSRLKTVFLTCEADWLDDILSRLENQP